MPMRTQEARGEIPSIHGEILEYSQREIAALRATATLAAMFIVPKGFESHLIDPKKIRGMSLGSMSIGIAPEGAFKGDVTTIQEEDMCVELAPRLDQDGKIVDFSVITRPGQELPKPVKKNITSLRKRYFT